MFGKSWCFGRKSSPSGHRSFIPKPLRPRRRPLELEEFEPRVTPSCGTPHLEFATLTINCTGGGNWVDLDHSGGTTYLNGVGFADATFSAIAIHEGGTGSSTVAITRVPLGRPVAVTGNGGLDLVAIGVNGSVQEILSPVTVTNPPDGGYTQINIDDSSDHTFGTVNVTASSVSGLGPQPIFYAQSDLSQLNVSTGRGGALVNVLSTPNNFQGVKTTVLGYAENTTVKVGNGGRLQGIRGELVIRNPPSYSTIEVDNSADTADHFTVFHETVTVAGAPYGKITGLGAAAISYKYADTTSVTLKTGTGLNATQVLGTGKPLTISNYRDSGVIIGNAGRLQDIQGEITLQNPGAVQSELIVDNSLDSANHANVRHESVLGGTYGKISGLGAAAIFYKYSSYDTGADLETGTGINAISVTGTGTPLYVSGRTNATTVTVGDGGRLDSIQGSVSISNASVGGTAVIIDDSTDPVVHPNVTLNIVGAGPGLITGLAPVPIRLVISRVNSLTINGGTAGNTFYIKKTWTPTRINGGPGNDTFNLGSGAAPPAASTITDLLGALTIDGGGGSNLVNIFDQSNPPDANRHYDLLPGTVTRVWPGHPPVSIHYVNANMRLVPSSTVNVLGTAAGSTTTITVGGGGDISTVNVQRTAAGSTTNVTGSPGADLTVNVGDASNKLDGIRGALSVNGGTGRNALNLHDEGNSVRQTFTINTQSIARTGMATLSYAVMQSVAVTGGGGAEINVQNTAAGTSTAITCGGGVDISTVNVQSTAAGSTTTITGGSGGGGAVSVGDASNKLDGIRGSLSVNGGTGRNALNLHDEGNSLRQTFTINAQSIARTGIATLSYAGMQSVAVTGGSGAEIHLQSTAAGTSTVVGVTGSGGGEIVGPDISTAWNVTGANAGSLSGPAFGGPVTFSGISDLIGGAAGNTFAFSAGATLSSSINGGGGTNTLDYSAFTSNVIVNLQLGSATAVGGSIANIQNVIGGNGGAPGTYNILVGNGGNVLTGGNGRRNLLIAGASASTLIGGDDDDILIGGTTAYDADLTSLLAIMNYWSGPGDYSTRVANLTTGTGVPLLDATTVRSNGGGNTLQGNAGGAAELNLFFGDLALDVYDWNPLTETFIAV